MKTFQYKVARIVIQTIAIFTILVNVTEIIYLYFSEIDRIEQQLARKPLVIFSDVSIYICAANILFSLVAAYCITSRLKFWMWLSAKAIYMQLAFTLCSVIYFYSFYKNEIILSAAELVSQPKFIAILRSFNIVPIGNSILEGFRVYMESMVNIFCLLQIFSAIGAYVQSWVFTNTVKYDLEVEKAPVMHSTAISTVGRDIQEESLRNLAQKTRTVVV